MYDSCLRKSIILSYDRAVSFHSAVFAGGKWRYLAQQEQEKITAYLIMRHHGQAKLLISRIFMIMAG